MEEKRASLRESFQRVLVMKKSHQITPEELEGMTMADFLAYKTVDKATKNPSTLDVLNIAKLSGETTDRVDLNITGIDKALSDCKDE